MSLLVKYEAWVGKLVKTLQCSKGQEGAVLMSRFHDLSLAEGLLGGYCHVKVLHTIVEDFSDDRKNLRWVSKLSIDCDRWEKVFESTLRVSEVPEEHIIAALVEGKIDVNLAVGLSNV